MTTDETASDARGRLEALEHKQTREIMTAFHDFGWELQPRIGPGFGVFARAGRDSVSIIYDGMVIKSVLVGNTKTSFKRAAEYIRGERDTVITIKQRTF